MEVNGEPEQFLRDQQVVVTYFGREMHVNKGKDKTGDSQEETTHSTDLTRDDQDEEGKDETMDTNEKGCNWPRTLRCCAFAYFDQNQN